ncbi:MAG: hypothetical protein ABJF11_18675 [Reichenbachiella sp.]|uniref:hypothetical protein n=1 Tax=Reichenbachiella sp. TaxID=2184521 RepID=UPI0032660D20
MLEFFQSVQRNAVSLFICFLPLLFFDSKVESTLAAGLIGSIKGINIKQALAYLWKKIPSKGSFDKALHHALATVDIHYNSQLFGSNIKLVFNNYPELKDRLMEIINTINTDL